MNRLQDRVAVITGGASGIGAATARLFVEEGARVLVGDIQEEPARALVAELGDRARFRRCDVSREDDIASLVDEAVAEWGQLDCMFNNAGFGGAIGPISTISEDDYDLTMDVLLKSAFFGMKHTARVMQPAQRGSIISTASSATLVVGFAGHLYSVAKAAVVHLTRSVAVEMAEYDIRVNCILPGYIATPLAAGKPLYVSGAEVAQERVERMRQEMANGQPMHRVGEPEDIARTALFLAGDESTYITGQGIVVDGGVTVGKPWRKQPEWSREPHPIKLYRPEGR